nr:2-amino-4-hydroxy-6-hydroxymethyldihydropteridine diphosphokinase [Caldimicrobium thiodismutans]
MGSNLGNRRENLERAIKLLQELPAQIEKLSKIYETRPLYFESKNYFYNLVVKIRTFLSPLALFLELKKIEFKMGRKKDLCLSDRPIDLDIVFYEDLRFSSAILKIPHPRALERAFVVIPTLEIEPDLREPVTGKKLCEIKQEREKEYLKQGIKALTEELKI